MTKALALLSGGLDSTLAIEVIKRQGIDVIALNIVTAFCRCTNAGSCKLEAVRVSENLNVPIKVINSTKEIIELVKNPKHGYGKNINPCIDCRINLFRAAGKYMKETGADFIFTGEVLGQRPMSQRKEAMKQIDREADLTGYVVRPLCAKHLEPTIPEQKGLVDRDKLLEIKGRSRKEQIHLADIFEIKDFNCPAGGCLLTDPEFAYRMRDLIDHTDAPVNDVHLLKVGRHFRIDEKTKVIVGRRDADNTRIEFLAQEGDYLFVMQNIQGPLSIIRGDINDKNIEIAAQITARYSKEQDNEIATVKITHKGFDDETKIVEVPPFDAQKAIDIMIKKPQKKSKPKKNHRDLEPTNK